MFSLERGELGGGLAPGRLAHPVERRDALAVGGEQVLDEHLHLPLRARRMVTGDVGPAERVAERLLDKRDTAPPAGQVLGRPAERGAREREGRGDEVVAEIGWIGVEQAGAQIRLPDRERRRRVAAASAPT
jgi:hypothetical protein